MRMSNAYKYNLFLLFVFLGIWTCRQLQPDKPDNINIDGIIIDKKPCFSAVNSLFGRAVDSIKACECILPAFYNAIKTDSLLVQKFKEYRSTFVVDGELSEVSGNAIIDCVRANIVDSMVKFNMTAEYKLRFKQKLNEGFKARPELENLDIEKASDCIIEKLAGNITVAEYFSSDYYEVPRLKALFVECYQKSSL